VTPILEPVIEEATSVLREWGIIAKDLFLVGLFCFIMFVLRFHNITYDAMIFYVVIKTKNFNASLYRIIIL